MLKLVKCKRMNESRDYQVAIRLLAFCSENHIVLGLIHAVGSAMTMTRTILPITYLTLKLTAKSDEQM